MASVDKGRNPRDEAVLAVLQNAKEALGPTEIARRIGADWCIRDGYPQSGAINPILKRIGTVREGNGRYKLPEIKDA